MANLPRFAGRCQARYLSASVALAVEKAKARKANRAEGITLALVLALMALSGCASSLTLTDSQHAAPAVALADTTCHD